MFQTAETFRRAKPENERAESFSHTIRAKHGNRIGLITGQIWKRQFGTSFKDHERLLKTKFKRIKAFSEFDGKYSHSATQQTCKSYNKIISIGV